jgi:hypothetical protein
MSKPSIRLRRRVARWTRTYLDHEAGTGLLSTHIRARRSLVHYAARVGASVNELSLLLERLYAKDVDVQALEERVLTIIARLEAV